MKKSKYKKIAILAIVSVILAIGLLYILFRSPKSHSQQVYTANELGISVITSEIDQDEDGVDDYTDIMIGGRTYINTNPEYKSKYYKGGYPDDNYGVCTDVIWNAFREAGYNLKDLIDTDIAENLDSYTTIETPDSNIDFRRVKNLNIFFERNAKSLSTNSTNPEEWQAGDIVVFTNHIAICSDKRNADGMPFIIHHDSKGAREVNEIEDYTIVGHYRWN